MAFWGRSHVIKAALVVGGILLLLNFYNYFLESKLENPTPVSMVHVGQLQWPKRTHTNAESILHSKNMNMVLNNTVNSLNNNNSSHNSINYGKISKTDADENQQPLHNITSSNIASIIYNSTRNTTINIKINNTSNNNTVRTTIHDYDDIRKVILDNNLTKNISSKSNVSATIVTSSSSSLNESLLHINKVINNGTIIKNSTITSQQPASDDTVKSTTIFETLMTTLGLNRQCPPIPSNLDGPIEVNTTLDKLSVIESRYAAKLLPGGWYTPKECAAKDRVAIIIPYRDRATHLPIFLNNIHPFLMKQQIEYGIFLIEQIAEGLFNRAALMNIGFLEALKMNDWDCFIFHDIDLLPLDDRNLYTCPDQPRHMSVAVDTMGFKLPYGSIFGGVSAMTVKQFKSVNGFSNSFWGWGGEDDDMSNRLKHVGFHIARYPVNIARYTMLNHKKEKANPKRFENLVNGAKRYDVEGLNSIHYKVHYLEKKILYTWVLVEVKPDSGS